MKLAFALLLSLSACAVAPAGHGGVKSWGTLREALRDGQTEARVDAAAVVSPFTVGIGALEGLNGEITIVDGEAFVSRGDGSGQIRRAPVDSIPATMLFTCEVSRWQDVMVERDVDAEGFDQFVRECARNAGVPVERPFPFVIHGGLSGLRMHVLAGECPVRAQRLGRPMESPPVVRRHAAVHGRVVGLHATNAGGVWMHHGDSIHAHVILDGDVAITGHVDAVGVTSGSVLRLPVEW